MDANQKTKPAKPKYNMWRCAGFMIATAWREHEQAAPLLCLLAALLPVVSNLATLYLPPTVVTLVTGHASAGKLMGAIGGLAAVAMLCTSLSDYVEINRGYSFITIRLAIIGALNRKSCLTSYPNLSDETFLGLRSKAFHACDGNSESTEEIWRTLTLLAQNAAGFVVYLALLATLEVWIVALVLVTATAGYLVNKHLSGYEYRHRTELAALEKQVMYHIDLARDSGITKDIRIFGLRPWLEEVADKSVSAYRAFKSRATAQYLWGDILDLVLAFLRSGAAYAYLITQVLSGGISAAQFLLYFSAVGGFSTWVNGILTQLTALHRQSLDISIVREVLDYPEPFTFEGGQPLTAHRGDRHELRLEDVSFRYPGADHDTLEHVDLTIRPGEKVAVVGLNGAGKTTLVKLICGFLDPTGGRVLLDGRDIRELNRRDYYKLFSAVFQDFSLLAADLASNISQDPHHADMERVRACVAQAGLTEKVESLTGGYNALLERSVYPDAAGLSGGQLQRLMLARALYKDAPFIILDEPTAALDPIAEAELYEKYAQMTRGCSSVYISHRLASTRFCDRVLFIDQHRIAEEGTHDQLLALGGKYAQLFEVQSKYYRKEEACHEDR